MFILISLKTEIARSVRGPKLQELRAEDALAEPYLVQNNFGDFNLQNCESRNNHRYAIVVQDLATQWIQVVSVQNKNFSGNTKELAKVLGAE